MTRNDETPLISSFRTDSLHPPCPLFLMDTVWTSLSWLRHETGQVRRSSCNEPVLVIIMSALRAISGQYWDWINQTEVNLQQNSQRWRLPHAHTGIAASQGQCPASPPQTHRGPGNQCIFVTQTPRLEPRAECTQGWVGLKYLVASCILSCHVCIGCMFIYVILRWLSWWWLQSGVSLVTGVMSAGHVMWRSACHHAMIATVCTNHNQGPWPARNALWQWPVSRHRQTNCTWRETIILPLMFSFSFQVRNISCIFVEDWTTSLLPLWYQRLQSRVKRSTIRVLKHPYFFCTCKGGSVTMLY